MSNSSEESKIHPKEHSANSLSIPLLEYSVPRSPWLIRQGQIGELLLNDSFMLLGLVTVIASGPIASYRSSRGSSLIFPQLQSGRDFTRISNILGVSLVVAHGSYL